jgi:selenide,water dikinase
VQVLKNVPQLSDPNLLVGTETGDDAGVYRINDQQALVFTVDFFPPIVDDPFDYGAIAVTNALSDIYAMGGVPLVGLNITGFPVDLPKEVLGNILRGGSAKAQEAGCLIIGGHTVDDQEPKYGLAAIGLVEPGKQVTNSGAQPGDRLVLTKPLGTGIITTAGKQGVADPQVMGRAVKVMSTLNRAASEGMRSVGANAATDVTGFGLVGHLHGMMVGSNASAHIQLSSVPVIDGVWDLLEKGVAPGGTHRNLDGVGQNVHWADGVSGNAKLLMCDAQTSGGLLISLPEDRTDELLSALDSLGVEGACVIGQVTARDSAPIHVSP